MKEDYNIKDIGNFYGENKGNLININMRQIFSSCIKRNMKSIQKSMVNLFVKTYIHEALHREIYKVTKNKRDRYILGEEKVVAKMLGESWTKKDEYYYKGYFEKE